MLCIATHAEGETRRDDHPRYALFPADESPEVISLMDEVGSVGFHFDHITVDWEMHWVDSFDITIKKAISGSGLYELDFIVDTHPSQRDQLILQPNGRFYVRGHEGPNTFRSGMMTRKDLETARERTCTPHLIA